MAAFVDFKELKTRVSIEDAISKLGLSMIRQGTQLRSGCPICKTGGDRALTVNLEKQMFYCFAKKKGGDCIELVAHIRNFSVSDAANFLNGIVLPDKAKEVSVTLPQAPAAKKSSVFDPAAYAARLDPSHELLGNLGVAAETFVLFASGYASTGTNRKRLAIPLHDRTGNFVCYFGRTLQGESPLLHFPNGVIPSEHIFNAHRVVAGELYLVRDPLQVLSAHEAGVENVVSFLSPITAQNLEMLSSLMDERKVETVELF